MKHEPAPWLRSQRPEPCPPPPDRCAPACDDQLPIFSRVGRGIKGDDITAHVEERDGHIYLVVEQIDGATGEHTILIDRAIDGGYLEYEYNLNPFNDPSTFTLTFHYDHPDHELSWDWTTPAIPYMWHVDPETGEPVATGIIGSGVSSLFLKKTYDEWETPSDDDTPHTLTEASDVQEKLLYPLGWRRSSFNAPNVANPWTVNLSYGIGGDIDAPNLEDISKIIGVDPGFIERIIEERTVPLEITFGDDPVTGDPYNVKNYIDNLDEHIHEDMGFGDILVNDGDADTQTPKRNTIKKWLDWIISRLGFGDLINPGNNVTVKQYIDNGDDSLQDQIDALTAKYDQALADILNKIYSGSGTNTMDPDTGEITWGVASGNKIPIADINIWAGLTEGNASVYANALRSRSLSDNDITFK